MQLNFANDDWWDEHLSDDGTRFEEPLDHGECFWTHVRQLSLPAMPPPDVPSSRYPPEIRFWP